MLFVALLLDGGPPAAPGSLSKKNLESALAIRKENLPSNKIPGDRMHLNKQLTYHLVLTVNQNHLGLLKTTTA